MDTNDKPADDVTRKACACRSIKLLKPGPALVISPHPVTYLFVMIVSIPIAQAILEAQLMTWSQV